MFHAVENVESSTMPERLISHMHASYEIRRLMSTAKHSIHLFLPFGEEFFGMYNFPPILHEAAERRIASQFLFSRWCLQNELVPVSDYVPDHGCEIRVIPAQSTSMLGYVIADGERSIQGGWRPGRDEPYRYSDLASDEKGVRFLARHFENVWRRGETFDTLYRAHTTEGAAASSVKLIDFTAWTERLRHLSLTPDDLKRLHWRELEELVAELLSRDGFETTLTPRSNDGGRDVLAVRHLSTGPVLWLVECKHYLENPVPIECVRALFGTVTADNASGGLLVTTSSFTQPAREFARLHEYRISLKERNDLVLWIRSAVGRK